MSTEVWITGAGAITAAGATSRALADAMQSGRSAVRPLPEFDGAFGAAVEQIPTDANSRRLDRVGRLFVAAATEAWREAGLDVTPLDGERVALVEGSSLGPMAAVLHALQDVDAGIKARPSDIVRFMPGVGGAAFAQAHNIKGAVVHLSAGSVSAACAIGEAFEKIACGRVDVAVAGGAESPLQRSILERFAAARVIRCDATPAPCRPFDQLRKATVLGEGAGVVILESRAHAMRRGARPLAVIRGYGAACEPHALADPDPSGAAVRHAVEAAVRGQRAPGWIKAHGTGTRAGDFAEYQGLHAVFGYGLPALPVTSLKPTIGHCLGASAGVETVATLRAIAGGFIPATLGTTCVDAALPFYDVVLEPRPCANVPVLLLAESFGGRAAALLLEPAM